MKKLISSALAVVMALSLASPFTGIAYADEVSQPAAELTETAPAGESGELQIVADTQPEDDAVPAESKAAAESTAPQESGEPEENAEPEETAEPKEPAGSEAASDLTEEEAASEAGAVSEEEKTPAQSAETEQAAAPVQDSVPENSAVSGEEETASAPTAVEQVADLFRALPKAEDLASMTDAEWEDVMARTTAAIDAYDALSVADGQAFLSQYGDLYDEVTNDLVAALLAGTGSETSDLSLQPMEETGNVYLTLIGYTKDQLKNFPVDDIPGMLTNDVGEPLEGTGGYTKAWFYFPSFDEDESHTLGAGETVDLWDYRFTDSDTISTTYSLCLVLSNGSQINDGKSHRYLVNVEIDTKENLDGNLTAQVTNANLALSAVAPNGVFDTLGMEGRTYVFYDTNYSADKLYNFTLENSYEGKELERRGIQVDVYPMEAFLEHSKNGQPLTGAITDDVMGTGYLDSYASVATADNYTTLNNLWCIVFTKEDTGRIVGYFGVNVVVKPISDDIKGAFYFYDGKAMQPLDTSQIYTSSMIWYYKVDLSSTGNGAACDEKRTSFSLSAELPQEYELDETYQLTLDKIPEIKTVYAGTYFSEEDAIRYGATDITSTIMSDDSQGIPYGYAANLGWGVDITLVMEDGAVALVRFSGYQQYNPGTGSGSTTRPRNDLDPNFQIVGAKDGQGKSLSYYIADMVSGVQLDTYYRTDDRYDVGGYQLMLLNEKMTREELEQIVPEFWTPTGVQVNSGVKVESGKSNLTDVQWSSSIDNTVMYQVQVPGEKLRNYQVTFATVQDQAQLLVAGPDERFVNLTADNNFVHDILVANIGKTDLTGVKVELINPVHVKLDNYWTLNEDTIPGFTGVDNFYESEDGSSIVFNSYATPENIAKVRLVADGEGEISGTLRITTANGGSRDIKLTGIAANPHIVSAALKDAVLYVPYSYMVVTDNMYKWNRSTFRIIDGRLPNGMMLYENTGEIYGNPTETGDFTFTVQVDYSSSRFSPSTATFTLHVADNTNAMVYNQTDEGYSIKVPLGVEQGAGTYDFYLADTSQDQLFVSNGVYPEFFGVWLNGQRLIQGLDYTSESGSTRITIKSQTFATKALKDDYNTIAMEFRVNGDRNNELKRTAQNFRLSDDFLIDWGDGDSSSSDEQNTSQNNSQAQTTPVNPAAIPNTLEGASGVTLRFYVKDAQGGPVVGATAELHSTPRYGTTDGNGCVVFSNVEFGSHTLKIYDANGNLMGSKSFVLSHGGFNIDGSVITVSDGALVDIDVKAANGTLVFQGVTLPQDQAATGGIPQTGDDFDPTLWILLAVLALGAAAGLTVYKKKNEQV